MIVLLIFLNITLLIILLNANHKHLISEPINIHHFHQNN